ncbi:MAG: hypothetical protein RMJ32_01370 [Aquificaceae bacterium]|nr:hypothetical protein [Aquificaceae bacterium]
MYPKILEDEEKIVVIYSEEDIKYTEIDDGVELHYSKDWNLVKIILKKDERYQLIRF